MCMGVFQLSPHGKCWGKEEFGMLDINMLNSLFPLIINHDQRCLEAAYSPLPNKIT